METLIHLLHLEDDPADAELVQATLAEAGLACRITLVQTRDQFETALGDGGTDIILADYRLPTYDGMSALRLAHGRCPEIPFIFVSGAMGEEAAIEALTKGATDYVLKQNLSRLMPAVRRVLQETRNRRECRQTQEALQRSNMINAARLRLMQFAVDHSLDELLEETINEAEKITDSLIGFYHLVDDDQQSLILLNWSTGTKTRFCKAESKGLHYPIAESGVWVDCVRERRPVVHNDYISLTHRRGLPAGHPEVARELVVPVLRGDKIKAILGVGNKPADYSEKDVEAMSLLADLVWEITDRKQAEQQVALMSFAMNSTHEAAFMVDEKACFHYVNDEASRLLGYARDELITMKVQDIIPGSDIESWTCHWSDLKAHGTLTFERQMKSRDGRTFPVEINANYFEYEGLSYNFGLVRDITERKQVERERLATLRFFESMDRVNRAIQRADSLDQMMRDVLDEVLSIFDAERVYLLHPCDPEADTWTVPMECSKPGFAGAVYTQRLEMPMEPGMAEMMRDLIDAQGPLTFSLGTDRPLPPNVWERHGYQSMITTALHPRVGKTWQFGIHQCSHPRTWTPEEVTLVREIGRRLSDGLSSLLSYRDLCESEAFLNNIVENIPNMIFVKDAREMKFVRLNRAGEALLRIDREEMLGKNEYDLFPWEEAHLLAAKDREILNGKALVNIPEETIKIGRNAKRILNTKKIPMLNENGVPQYLLGIAEDITERKQAEESIRKLSQAVEQSPVSIVITDVEGRIEFVNAKFTQITGYSIDEAMGRNPRILKSGETTAGEYRRLWKTISSGGVWRGEFHNRKKDGDLFWERATIAPLRNAHHRITHYIAVKEDITQRKLAERALREKQNFIRNILDSVDEGFIVVDAQFSIRSANRAFCEMVHAAEAAVVDRLCYTILHQATRPCFESGEICPVRQTFATGKAQFATHTHEDASGIKQHVELKAYPITDASGTVVSVIETFNDVTEKRKLEEQLLHAQKMESVGRLAGGVAHDFNNMLGVIIGYSEMTLDQIGPGNPLFENLEQILKAAKRSGNLTRQLLAFARQQVVTPRVLDLNETVEGMIKMLRRLIGEDIELAWQPGMEVGPVKMDPAQIDQILANLCVNARDAIAGVGQIIIKTGMRTFDRQYCADHAGFTPGNFVVMTVSDDGQGMDKATLNMLFEPFFTTKDLGKGTGLGLATVYGIVKQNDGFINVYSEPGCGTTFRIYLPRHLEKDALPEKENAALSISRGHGTILLVEDNPDILKMTRLMLESLGYRVLIAATPGEAMHIAGMHENDIHLLLTDVVMPEMNGYDLAKKLLSLYPSIRHLFMSGYPGDFIAHRGVLDEGVHFIQKPFSIQDLSAKLFEILGES